MNKKVLAFLLATSMLISMTGCDKKRNTGVDDNKDEKVTTATDNPVDDEKKRPMLLLTQQMLIVRTTMTRLIC